MGNLTTVGARTTTSCCAQDCAHQETTPADSNRVASVIHRHHEPHAPAPASGAPGVQHPISLSPICLPLPFPIFPNLSALRLAENPVKWLIFLTFPNVSSSSPQDLKSWGP